MMRKAVALAIAVAAAGCNNHAATKDMGSGCVTIGGVCLFPPAQKAVRTPCGDVSEYCDATAMPTPNLGCLTSPVTPPAGPATVTLTGFVHAFSSGPDSKGVSIAIYDAAALKGASAPMTALATLDNIMLDPLTMRACDADGTKGCSIPATSGCTVPSCADGLAGRPDQMKYCHYDSPTMSDCSQRLRWEARYTIAGIPTNKQLVIRSTGMNGAADQTWATVFAWNVFLSTADRDCAGDLSATDCWDKSDAANPKYQLNISALSQSDYVNIPQTAGLSGGVPQGQGAVAGEVHDCDNIRIGNVVVGVVPQAARFTYFNGDPIKTVPDTSRLATDRLGLYAGLSVAPGPASVVAAGTLTDGGALTSFGAFDAQVFADSVTVININGGKPH
jgi:hypothetical protein